MGVRFPAPEDNGVTGNTVRQSGGAFALRDRRVLLIAGATLVVLVAAALIIRGLQPGPSGPVKLPALHPLQYGADLTRGDVRKLSGTTLTLDAAGGSRDVELAPGTRVEVLLPATPDQIVPGDYLVVGGIPNLVNSFAVKLVVDIPAAEAAAPAAGGLPRSTGGFTGWETFTNPAQAPEVYGRVDAAVPGGFVLSGPLGKVTVLLDGQSALRRLNAGGVEQIHGGDHVAVRPGAGTQPETVLVLPGQ